MPTGGKLAAGILMMFAMAGGMITYLDDAGFEQTGWAQPIIAAGLVGFWAGWSQLGTNLGREFLHSGVFAIGSGMVALVFFALIYGLRSAYITHSGVQFAAAIDVIAHILDVGITVIQTTVASKRTLAALVIGCLISGIVSEYCHRIWK
ncbi:MAG: TrgA family protein [Pseudomonadota bacterium]